MAKDTTTEAPKKKRGSTSMAVWLLMAMLVTGLGGLGVTNFGKGVTAIGKVGDREMSVNEYARALKQELSALSAQFGQQISLSQATALGLDRSVLQGLIIRTAMDAEDDRLGVSVGNAVVANQVASNKSFQGLSGGFDRDAYAQVLKQNGMTVQEYESGVRDDISRQILQGAVVGGFAAPSALIDTLYAYQGERRGFSVLHLAEANLAKPLTEATEADLKAYYDANIATFTRPESKRITFVALLPDTLAPSMTVDEKALKDLYQSRIDEFVIPEKRLVERLVYGSEDEAKAAKARLDASTATFEDLVKERKLTLDDIDMGDVSMQELGAAGEAIFALKDPGVVGPLPSDLGPALFRMNGILVAQETAFDAAKDQLAGEMRADAARRAIADKVEAIDDELAGGATLEDLARDQGMTLGTTDYAKEAEDNDPIAAYPAFRDAADKVAEGDFPEAVLLDDGGVVALRLDSTQPPTPIPFDKAHDKVAAAWHAEALAKALADQAIAVKSAVEGGASLGANGIVDVTPVATRDHFVEGAPADLMTAVFQMAVGDLRVITSGDYVAVVRLDSITPAASEGDDAKTAREAIATTAQQGLAKDAFALYSTALTSQAGITLDQAAINAVHAQFN